MGSISRLGTCNTDRGPSHNSSMMPLSPGNAPSLRLRLPLELLDRIVQLACEHPPAMPLDPAPPPPPSALLLVSKGFTSLALPHFYRTITIYHRSDWTSFFDPNQGLFVVGEQADLRRRAVVELNIRVEGIPIDTDRVHPLIDKSAGDPNYIDDYYVPIASVSFPSLVRVCLLAGPDREATVRAVQSTDERSLSRRLWAAIPRSPGADNLTGLVSNVIGDRVGGSLARKLKARRAEVYRTLLGSSPVRAVHLTLGHDDHRHIYAHPCPKAMLYVHTSPSDFEDRLCERSYVGAGKPEGMFTLVDLSCSDQDVAVVGMSDETRRKLAEVAKMHTCRNMFSVETLPGGQLGEPERLIDQTTT